MDDRHRLLLLSPNLVGWEELRRIVSEMPDMQVIGDTQDPIVARRIAMTKTPDAVIATTSFGGRSTISLLADFRRSGSFTAKAIIFAAEYVPEELGSPATTGVVGCLLWSDLSPAVLRHCLSAAIAGDIILASGPIVRQFARSQSVEAEQMGARITSRERSVLIHLASGLTREEIAIAEAISVTTVKRIIADLETKLEVPNLFMLAVRATQLGIISG